jgi:hypothetical protein
MSESRADVQGSDPHAISRLMELNAEPQQLWKAEELGEILAHQLSMPATVESFGNTGQPLGQSGPTLRQLLTDSNPPLELLRTIHRAAKADCSSDSALLPRDVALVIYYACIASALVHLNQRISDLDDAKLKQAFVWSLKRKWLDAGLIDVFQQADSKFHGEPGRPRPGH